MGTSSLLLSGCFKNGNDNIKTDCLNFFSFAFSNNLKCFIFWFLREFKLVEV